MKGATAMTRKEFSALRARLSEAYDADPIWGDKALFKSLTSAQRRAIYFDCVMRGWEEWDGTPNGYSVTLPCGVVLEYPA